MMKPDYLERQTPDSPSYASQTKMVCLDAALSYESAFLPIRYQVPEEHSQILPLETPPLSIST